MVQLTKLFAPKEREFFDLFEEAGSNIVRAAELSIPTIGIGAGRHCDGQVLVCYDLLGMNPDFKPKFVKRYADVGGEMLRGLQAYAEEVRTRRFPGPEHAYGIAPEELHRLREQLEDRQRA